jgi:phosphoribosyl 1,2-cyclic phosphodiesterase
MDSPGFHAGDYEKIHKSAMASNDRMAVTFWGVRGSAPTPVADNLNHGGNTTCIEILAGDDTRMIIDAGTGIRLLGQELVTRYGGTLEVHLFFTHFHWDHIQGLPFFRPLYSPANLLTFYSDRPPAELYQLLSAQMQAPYFPVIWESVCPSCRCVQVGAEPVWAGRVSVRSFPLHHPQGGCGYKFSFGGAVVVHACDLEHGNKEKDDILVEVCHEADLLIYDTQFTPEEYGSRRGWGHSTWLEAVRVARRASVKKLILFHHEPNRTDEQVEHLVELAREHFPNTIAAREGLTIQV